MKIIGITGKSGTGKTTLAGMLSEMNDAKIISLDCILDGIKDSTIMQSVTQEYSNKDKQTNGRMLNIKLSSMIYKYDFILKKYLSLRNIICNNIMKKQLSKFKSDNEQLVIIEGTNLPNLDVINELDMLILIKVPYHVRLDRVSKRDNIYDKMYVVKRDKKFQRETLKAVNRKIDYIVDNNGDIEDLKNNAEKISDAIKIITMSRKEKFKRKNKVSVSNIKTNQINNNRRRKESDDKEIY